MKRITEVYRYRTMIGSLVKRDLRGRYKASVLGFLWTFLNPLLQLIVYTIVFSMLLKNGIENYYLFLFVALVPWIFFSSSLTGGSSCIITSKDMVKKIYFPREVLPIAHVTCQFVNMLFSFIIIFLVLIVSGQFVNPLALCFLPIIMAVEYLLALGIAMLSSALTVYFRDLQHILIIIAMAWQYLSPVMYSVDIIPERWQVVFMLNPMTSVIVAYRDILYYKQIPELSTLGIAAVMGALLLVIGWFVFGRLQRRFAEVL